MTSRAMWVACRIRTTRVALPMEFRPKPGGDTLMSNELILRAPVSGVVYPLERVPDPVFAQKLMGDGLSIDPVDSTLRAPCAGEVVHIHPASHALTLRAGSVEAVMHTAIDTVA